MSAHQGAALRRAPDAVRRQLLRGGGGALVGACGGAALVSLAGCVSVGGDGGAVALTSHELHDPGLATAGAGSAGQAMPSPLTAAQSTPASKPVVAALLIQPLPGSALADTSAMAYSRRANEFAYYQLASWTERPVRQLPRLLQRRLQASGLAGAVALLGEPLRADWLLAVTIDTLHHDVAATPGAARLALSAELFDRRNRSAVARRMFQALVPVPQADAAAAAAAMSQAVAQVFDALLPWLAQALRDAQAGPG